MTIQRDDVINALRAEDVAEHLGIKGQWRGYWLRSDRCAEADHTPGSGAFGLKRDGHWHCWSCDKGGDLLGLVALGAGIDIKADFPKLLELAAGIAGIDLDPGADLFGLGPTRPPPKQRVVLPPQAPLHERIALAKKRAAWAWGHLSNEDRIPEMYLRSRGLDPVAVLAREELRATPLRIPSDLRRKIDDRTAPDDLRTLWYTMGVRRGSLAMVCPVRSVHDGAMLDLRARRVEPEAGQPKIIGMVGGITSAPAERGKTRQLIACYGRPHAIDADLVVITEGILDYLTALQLWPNAQVLGAVEAGTLSLVTAHAALALAARDNHSRLVIIEQADPPRLNKATGQMVPGAADQAINEDPNSATKNAVRILRSSSRVGWLYCNILGDNGMIGGPLAKLGGPLAKLGGKPAKDLNDLVVAGADVEGMLTWWSNPSSSES